MFKIVLLGQHFTRAINNFLGIDNTADKLCFFLFEVIHKPNRNLVFIFCSPIDTDFLSSTNITSL